MQKIHLKLFSLILFAKYNVIFIVLNVDENIYKCHFIFMVKLPQKIDDDGAFEILLGESRTRC